MTENEIVLTFIKNVYFDTSGTYWYVPSKIFYDTVVTLLK